MFFTIPFEPRKGVTFSINCSIIHITLINLGAGYIKEPLSWLEIKSKIGASHFVFSISDKQLVQSIVSLITLTMYPETIATLADFRSVLGNSGKKKKKKCKEKANRTIESGRGYTFDCYFVVIWH